MPLGTCVPLHAPDAEHEVALVEDQVKVEPLPLGTLAGFALIDIVGALGEGALLASPLIVSDGGVVTELCRQTAPAMATAKVLVPVNGTELLMGITKVFGESS